MSWIARARERLSDRAHDESDAFAGQAGWTTTKATGRFGFGARIYRDPRFGQPRAGASTPLARGRELLPARSRT